MRRLLLFILACTLLAGCGGPPPIEGRIVTKDWRDEFEHEHDGGQTCIMHDSKTYMCTLYVDNPDYYHHHPAEYWLNLQYCEYKEGKEKCKRWRQTVPYAAYNEGVAGMWYNRETGELSYK